MKKVLIVDDEEDLLRAMKVRLTSWGYSVITAGNGKEAMELIKTANPKAVLLDIVMPQMDGIETLRRIRELDKGLPVLILTAYGDEKRFDEARALGISGFIQKGAGFQNSSEIVRIALKGQKGQD